MSHFYPEMGHKQPSTALIVAKLVRMGFYVKWKACDNKAVVEALANAKAKVKNVEPFVTIKGEEKISGMMTIKAFDKIRNLPIVTQEMLLD